jgi:hypothetical protein
MPNWELASTTFDTGDPSVCGSGGCGDKDYLFWVVIWPELTDNEGNPALRSELPDHSLTRIPPLLSSPGDICPLDNDCVNGSCRATRSACVANSDCETAAQNTCRRGACAVSGVACTSDADCGACLCAICMGRFSNNVAFYHQPIAINPEATEAGQTSVPALPGGAAAGVPPGELALERISVTPATARIGDQVVVRAGLRAMGNRIDGQVVRFYAVPPDAANLTVAEVFDQVRTFDQEILARIRAGRVHEAQVPFFPGQLGRNQILVSGFVDGEERLLGTTELEVVETLPTPTTVPDRGDDDSCAISERGGSSSGFILLALVPAFLVLFRSRRRRGR